MRFIHIADVHLGACPNLGFPWSKTRENEIWESFSRIIEKIKSEKTDVLLIAGDLFHGQPLLRELKELNYLFGQIPDTEVVLMAGNHDYLKKDSAYRKIAWEKNVTGFWKADCECRYLKSCNTYVYGLSYMAREQREPLYNLAFQKDRQYLADAHNDASHILLAHGGDEKHIPIQFASLAAADFDYIALGHIHQPRIIVPNKMAYAGSLEPLDHTELGEHGYIEGVIEHGNTKIQFVPFSSRQYKELKLSVTTESTVGSILDNLKECIVKCGSEHMYCVRLQGVKASGLVLDEEYFLGAGNVVEVIDETTLDYDFEQLRQMYAGTLISAYIDRFLEKDTLSEVERKALYYGVDALLGTRE